MQTVALIFFVEPKHLFLECNVSVHSHWIMENFTPGSKYSPYCRLILQWYLHYSSTQKHHIILVNYTTLIGLNWVQCFCIFPLRFGETNIFSEFRMAEDTTLPIILNYRLGLHQPLCLTNPVSTKFLMWRSSSAILYSRVGAVGLHVANHANGRK